MQFDITITSDTVCPWCYIGYRRLKIAIGQHLASHPQDAFTISWNPFQLHAAAPKGQTVDKIANYESKLGAEQTQLVFERLRSAAQGTGITFSFAGRTGNTLDSHRLIELAAEKQAARGSHGIPDVNLPTRVVEELFADYFEREKDISSHDVLVNAAKRAGLDEGEVQTLLNSNTLISETTAKARMSREQVNGVPHFEINEVFNVEGAQEPAAFLTLFNRLKKRQQLASKSTL